MRPVLTIISVLLVLIIVHRVSDREGWISHDRDTPVFMPSDNWMVGEFRECEMQVITEDDHRTYFLDCASREGKLHELPVKYWGRLDREGHFDEATGFRFLHWRCQRLSDSLVCKAID